MKKIVIIILSVFIIAMVIWKVYDYYGNKSKYATGIYETDLNYIRNTNSSADRFISTLNEQLSENPESSVVLTKNLAQLIFKKLENLMIRNFTQWLKMF
jgi:hypothetical protein